jgi:hypothetical protein
MLSEEHEAEQGRKSLLYLGDTLARVEENSGRNIAAARDCRRVALYLRQEEVSGVRRVTQPAKVVVLPFNKVFDVKVADHVVAELPDLTH